MGDPLGREQQQGQDGKGDLKILPAELLRRDGALPPPRGRILAQRADSPDHVQVGERAGESKEQHGDANGILMEAASRRVDAGGRRQSRKADSHANAAHGQDRRTRALQYGEDNSRPVENCQPSGEALLPRGGRVPLFPSGSLLQAPRHHKSVAERR